MNEENNFLVKAHKSYRLVVAICDKDLYGRKVEEGDKQLDLTGPFFAGEEKSRAETADLIRYYLGEDATFNIVGENSCKIAQELGIVKTEGVIKISNVPYALVLL
jgi:hypothetical protein